MQPPLVLTPQVIPAFGRKAFDQMNRPALWRAGTEHLLMSPLQFMQRLAALMVINDSFYVDSFVKPLF